MTLSKSPPLLKVRPRRVSRLMVKSWSTKVEASVGLYRQQHLAVAFGVQGVAVVVGVAHVVVVGIEPADQTEDVQKDLVEPLRAEDGAMAKFMRGDAAEEAGDRAVAEKRQQKGAPELQRPEVKDQRAGEAERGPGVRRPGTSPAGRCGGTARAVSFRGWGCGTTPRAASCARQPAVDNSSRKLLTQMPPVPEYSQGGEGLPGGPFPAIDLQRMV